MIASTPDKYLGHLQSLLPQGVAWPREPGTVLTAVLAALADGLHAAHTRADRLIEEADPRTTDELLPDWERVCGLPDPCTGSVGSVAERRAQVVTRLTATGGQSRDYFIALARTLGFDIIIAEHRARFHGRRPMGGRYGLREQQFVWEVRPQNGMHFRRQNDETGGAYAAWGMKSLMCLLERLKPAHTRIIWKV